MIKEKVILSWQRTPRLLLISVPFAFNSPNCQLGSICNYSFGAGAHTHSTHIMWDLAHCVSQWYVYTKGIEDAYACRVSCRCSVLTELYILAQRCDAWQKLCSHYGMGTEVWPARLHTCFFANLTVFLLATFLVVLERVYNASAVLKDCLASCFSRARAVIKYSLPPNSSD